MTLELLIKVVDYQAQEIENLKKSIIDLKETQNLINEKHERQINDLKERLEHLEEW